MYSFLQAAQQEICISKQLTPAGQGIVNCIFCVEIFIDLSRSQGTKDEILLPSPSLDVQSASVHATNSKFPEESTIQHQTSFTLQDTAIVLPQMPLENPEFTTYMSSLLKKVLQNSLDRHALEKSLEVVTHQVTPHRNPKIVGSTVLNRSGTLQKHLNRLQKKDDAPHWLPIATQGCFQDSKVSCLCSGHWFFNDRANYQLKFMNFY